MPPPDALRPDEINNYCAICILAKIRAYISIFELFLLTLKHFYEYGLWSHLASFHFKKK
jgi:hypothetical protein